MQAGVSGQNLQIMGVRQSSPEEELIAKRDECSKLQAELADRELYLVNLRVSLTAFEQRYLRKVGTLYAELDEWNAKIAAQLAEQEGTENARAARSCATISATSRNLSFTFS